MHPSSNTISSKKLKRVQSESQSREGEGKWASFSTSQGSERRKPTFDVVHFPLVDSPFGCEPRLGFGSSPASVQIKQSFLLAVTMMREKRGSELNTFLVGATYQAYSIVD